MSGEVRSPACVHHDDKTPRLERDGDPKHAGEDVRDGTSWLGSGVPTGTEVRVQE